MNLNGCWCSIEILIPADTEDEKEENKSTNNTANIYSKMEVGVEMREERTENLELSLQFPPIRFSTLSFHLSLP